MPISMYQASVPVFVRHLGNLSEILKKGVAHAEERAEAPSLLLEARLAPDMFPLVQQVQRVSDTAKGAAARLTGVELTSFPDTETTFEELHERIRKTVAFLEGVPAEKFDGSETREIVLRPRGGEMRFDGQRYLLNFALPNFFFHVTITYALLREQGVPIGKMDYLGSF